MNPPGYGMTLWNDWTCEFGILTDVETWQGQDCDWD